MQIDKKKLRHCPNVVALDIDNNPLHISTLVNVNGNYSGKSGEIKRISKRNVFIRNNCILENYGYIVVNSSNLRKRYL